ncbi:phage holin family protein [Neptunitalea lumnitzerae]|uniref:Holin n=1 Tax=Neptunitalea lumnitzerae TaxID=2965509 RepID=A0ABQ5MEE8_9FLAO|nr:phage holin family protein [Neptunitalea sp. Y10]GLB47749.1 hypothetical protein Y10_01170 [Neptunitalea sp. Y10]
MPNFITPTKTIHLLLVLIVLDFITGICASFIEKKRAQRLNPELKNEILLSSEKLRMTGVKFFLYGATILLAYYIEKIFLIKSFTFSFSSATFSLSIIVTGFWIVVEFYSVVFENFKRMGFDVIEKTLNIVQKFKTTKKQLKNEKS